MTEEHSDVKANNVTMDSTSIYFELPHPANSTSNWDLTPTVKPCCRTSQPVKYYYIDFGLSCIFLTPPTDLLKCQ